MVTHGHEYINPGLERFDKQRRSKKIRRLRSAAKVLGFSVVPLSPAASEIINKEQKQQVMYVSLDRHEHNRTDGIVDKWNWLEKDGSIKTWSQVKTVD